MKNKFKALSLILMAVLLAYNWQDSDAAGKNKISWQIEPMFNSTSPFSEGLASVVHNGTYVYITREGYLAFDSKFVRANAFSESLASVMINSKTGFIDKNGTVVIQPVYDYAYSFSEGMALVQINDKYGFIDKSGKLVIKPEFDAALSFHEGMAAVCRDQKWGYINTSGEIKIKPRFEYVKSFCEGMAYFYSNEKCGFIDKSGKIAIKPVYDGSDSPEGFFMGFAKVYLNEEPVIINKKGKIVKNPGIDLDLEYPEGIYPYNDNKNSIATGSWGYKDTKGNVVIEPAFYWTSEVSEGLAAVCDEDNGYGFIRNPLSAAEQEEHLSAAGLYVGSITPQKDNRLLVSGKNISELVYPYEKLCLFANEGIIILRAKTVTSKGIICEIVSGEKGNITSTLKVYKYRVSRREYWFK